MNKTSLRRKLQAEQANFDNGYVMNSSRTIAAELRSIIKAEKPKSVLLYTPVQNWREVDVTALLEDLPDVKFDVLENAKDAPFPTETYDVIVVPLLGFSGKGFRLGRGGGWYDKFLATQPDALKIGVGYESSLVDFESEPHDVPMDAVVTDEQTRDFTQVEYNRGMKIILASQSPRRRDYMEKMFGRDGFEAIPSDIPEPFDDILSFTENAEQLALAKAKHVQQSYPDALIIASDTIVEVDGQLLAKAETKQEAEDMIRLQLGKETHVVSALAVLSPDKQIVTHAFTELYFKDPDDPGVEAVLTRWVESEKWRGLGGAYAIQDDTSKIIQAIRGDIANVIGLPVQKLRNILETEYSIKTKEVRTGYPQVGH